MSFFYIFELSIILAFILDLLFANPFWIPHPVVIIGKGISFLEKNLRKVFPDTPKGKRAAGGVSAAWAVEENGPSEGEPNGALSP